MRRVAVLLCAVAAVLLAVLLRSGGDGDKPPRFTSRGALPSAITVGVNASVMFNGAGLPPDAVERHLAGMERAGIRTLRTDALWSHAEPERGRWDWRDADRIAEALARHGITWWPVLGFAPGWASDAGGLHAPPRDPVDFGSFAAAFVRRYGAGGAFWSAHPDLPARPVRVAELWNEPNVGLFWPPKPDPAAYAAAFVAGAEAVRRADPAARVLLGGSAPSREWIPALVRARPEIRRLAAGAAFHPYGVTPARVLEHVRTLRRLLGASGLDVPIEVTETGWETRPPTARWFAPDARRANWIDLTGHLLAREPALRVDAYLPYSWVTAEQDPAAEDQWYGLVPPSGRDEDTLGAQALAGLMGTGRAP